MSPRGVRVDVAVVVSLVVTALVGSEEAVAEGDTEGGVEFVRDAVTSFVGETERVMVVERETHSVMVPLRVRPVGLLVRWGEGDLLGVVVTVMLPHTVSDAVVVRERLFVRV